MKGTSSYCYVTWLDIHVGLSNRDAVSEIQTRVGKKIFEEALK